MFNEVTLMLIFGCILFSAKIIYDIVRAVKNKLKNPMQRIFSRKKCKKSFTPISICALIVVAVKFITYILYRKPEAAGTVNDILYVAFFLIIFASFCTDFFLNKGQCEE